MATVVCKEIAGKLFILGIHAYRRKSDNKPTSNSVTLGKIDTETRRPLYNDKFLPWVTAHGLQPDTALKDYLIRNKKKFDIDFTNHSVFTKSIPEINTANTANVDTVSLDIYKQVENNNLLSLRNKNLVNIRQEIQESKKCFYGSTYLLNHISKNIGLDDILNEIFLDQAKFIKTLAFFNILEHKALMYTNNFVENYDIPLLPTELGSQRSSEILLKITEKESLLFYNLWANTISEKEYLALDSTSISTYSNLLSKRAFGHNKQNEKLKQVNLCFIFGEESGLPIYSATYNGSLHDVTTLLKTIKECSFVQDHSLKLVLDRGFYSKKNIDFMIFSPYKTSFIIGLPATTSLNKTLIQEHIHIFDNIKYAFQLNGDTYFAATKKIKWENKYINAHIYINADKNDKSRDPIVNEIIMMYNNACENPKEYIDEPDYKNALIFRKAPNNPKGYIITKNNKAYQEFRICEGWFVLLSNTETDAEKTLKIYRNRDVVEKAFDILKHFQKHKRTRVKSDEAYESKVFIGFLSMILIAAIHNVMQKNDLYKKKTMDELLGELSSIKALIYDNEYIIDPLTKSVKDYLDMFDCPYPDSKK
ncbi:MAG: transposase [Deltaproteobacteria bacterium]|nr:transposase [Deltaproteobacteria bacterium]